MQSPSPVLTFILKEAQNKVIPHFPVPNLIIRLGTKEATLLETLPFPFFVEKRIGGKKLHFLVSSAIKKKRRFF
jgi:hypothetical protein